MSYQLVLESLLFEKVTNKTRIGLKKYPKLYHITKIKYKNSILKYGLIRKKGNEFGMESLQNAVYLHNDPYLNFMYRMENPTGNLIIFEVNTSDLDPQYFSIDDDHFWWSLSERERRRIQKDGTYNKKAKIAFNNIEAINSLIHSNVIAYNKNIPISAIKVNKILKSNLSIIIQRWVEDDDYNNNKEFFDKHGFTKDLAIGNKPAKGYQKYYHLYNNKKEYLGFYYSFDYRNKKIDKIISFKNRLNDKLIKQINNTIFKLWYEVGV